MTLVLALASAGGIVLASDSQATYSTTGQPSKTEVQKIYCPWTTVAWGAAGHVGMIQRVNEGLSSRFSSSNSWERASRSQARERLTNAVAETLRPLWEKRIMPVEGTQAPMTTFLFAGYASDEPFILEVEANFSDGDHITTGYAAIGSGDIFPYYAMASLAHYEIRSRSLDEAKLIAYRVIQDAINVAAYGIGGSVQMIEIKKPAKGSPVEPARTLSDDETRILEDAVSQWKVIESETLANSLGLNPPQSSPDSPD